MASENSFQSITNAPVALTQDQSKRLRKYTISMGIRTICFISSVFLPSPFRWFAIVGAVTLPYISVVVANAGRETIFRKSEAPKLNELS
jgi:hypothetical protein